MTADNPYTGETKIKVGASDLTLIYDFRALASIHAECGPLAVKNFFNRDDIWQQSPEVVAKIVHAGLKKNHSEVTLDMVLDGLPPYAETVATVSKALVYAYFGPDVAEASAATGEPEEDLKKN